MIQENPAIHAQAEAWAGRERRSVRDSPPLGGQGGGADMCLLYCGPTCRGKTWRSCWTNAKRARENNVMSDGCRAMGREALAFDACLALGVGSAAHREISVECQVVVDVSNRSLDQVKRHATGNEPEARLRYHKHASRPLRRHSSVGRHEVDEACGTQEHVGQGHCLMQGHGNAHRVSGGSWLTRYNSWEGLNVHPQAESYFTYRVRLTAPVCHS